ncbi:MAG TPA: glycosyltransferase [Candidatus Omnitrophica bacterium]|nr:glycosyltransferase [Candidatus Omnitrophota bacterium]
MQILLITKHLNTGGIPRYVINLAKGLKENGHQVYVASSGGILVLELTQYNICHITIPINTKSILSPQILKSLLTLIIYFRKKHIDIIHSHTRVTSVLANMLTKYLKAHHITTVHGIYKKKVSRIVIPCLAKKIIAVSQETKDRLQNWQKISPDRIEVIPNAIDVDFFANYKLTRNEVRKKLGLEENAFIIGNISRIEKIKGQELIITAFIQLKEKIENLKLIFVGEGKDKLRLQRMVEKNFFKDVFFWGAKEDIRPYL